MSDATVPKEEEILQQAQKCFMRNGIKAMTMDDVARFMRVSKKTLYQFFSDKNDLVERMVGHFCTAHEQAIEDIRKRNLNAIDEHFEITRYIAGQLAQMHPSIHYDLEKYHPKAWATLQHTEDRGVMETLVANMEKGIREGLYRDDLDITIIARIYVSRMDAVFDGELFPVNEYSFVDVLWEQFRYHIRGIASPKGVQYLMKKMNKERK
ncbi:MAG: TetR/AcrR family transcriptional regulator [Flavobacteriales bacterium]|nr:TetR/AcrR family transcriptional regulator [Flavobacteriales bacterium]